MAAQLLKGSPEPIAALNRVKILEYSLPLEQREPLVDVRVHCPNIVWQDHVCPYLRKTVAQMVNSAAASLPSGYKLRAGTALRTLHMQKGGWDSYFNRMKTEHSEWPLSALRRATNKYFAPYDQPAPPGHCTGGAIDVGLMDPDGNSLDMIAPTSGWEAAYTWSDKISPEAHKNRMMMVEAMLGAGFSNCRDEYWHYSYGDSAWAVRTGAVTCPYGWAYALPEASTAFDGATATIKSIQSQHDKSGRFVTVDLRVAAANQENLAFALLWSRDCDIQLDVDWQALPASNRILFISSDRKSWDVLQPLTTSGATTKFTFNASNDRLYFYSNPPPPEEPKVS